MPPKLTTPAAPSRNARAALRSVRCASGLTQEQAAALAGVSPRVWRKWESGRGALLALDAYLILGELIPANDNPRRRAAEPKDGERRAPRLDPDRSTMPGACGGDTALHRRAA